MDKYAFTQKSKVVHGIKVMQIIALQDIPLHGVKTGDLGGWSNDKGLSQSDSCWIYPDATLIDSTVKNDTLVKEGVIENSTVDAKEIACSWINKSTINGKAVTIDRRCLLQDTHIETDGEVKVTGASELHNVKLFASDVYIDSASILTNMAIRGTKITVTKKTKISGGKLEGDSIYITNSDISKSTPIEGNDIGIEESVIEDFKMNGDRIFLTRAKLVKGKIRANRLYINENSDIFNCHIKGNDISFNGDVKLHNSSVHSNHLCFNGELDIDWVYFEGDSIELEGVVRLEGIEKRTRFKFKKKQS